MVLVYDYEKISSGSGAVGISRFLSPEPGNKIDEEIVRNIKELALQANPPAKNTRYGREKWVCRKMLAKRLFVGIFVNDTKKSAVHRFLCSQKTR